jgi:hypothetical protein
MELYLHANSNVISMNSLNTVIANVIENSRDFYFRALRSLVVLSFPQPLSFSSVFPSL